MAKKDMTPDMVVEAPKVYCLGKLTAIQEVKPNPENPNVHPHEQLEVLAGILRVNGWRQPIVVSRLSGLVVKGHGRLQTAEYMRLKEVPVDFQDYVDPQAEYQDMIADNRAAQLSYVDAFKLGNILKKVSADGQKHLGYSQEEIALFAAADYVAPKETGRSFVVLDAIKMTRDQKAIIVGGIQKLCLRRGKEVEQGEALADIVMAWQVMVLPTIPQAEVAAKPAPAAPEAPAAEKPAPKRKKKDAPAPAAPVESRASNGEPEQYEREFAIRYVAGTTLGDEDVHVVRPEEDDVARYYTKDADMAARLKKAKEAKKKVLCVFEKRGAVLWVISCEEVA